MVNMKTWMRTCFVLLLMMLCLCSCGDDGGDVDTDEDIAGDDDSAADDDNDDDWTPVSPHKELRGNYTIVWLEGTPYEMGFQHGTLLHDEIGEGLAWLNPSAMTLAIRGMA